MESFLTRETEVSNFPEPTYYLLCLISLQEHTQCTEKRNHAEYDLQNNLKVTLLSPAQCEILMIM